MARALAVFGMFTVHLGATSFGALDGPVAEAVHELTRGRSSALFAFLAGVSLALLSGRQVPLHGEPLRRICVKILVRAGLLALFGVLLDELGTSVAVILVYYACYFLLALPLLQLRAPALAATAAGIALLGPQLSYLIRTQWEFGLPFVSVTRVDDFLLYGYYPAFTFMAFVVAGMAVGRLDLRSTAVRGALAAAGAALALLGYGLSWLLLYPAGAIDRIAVSQAPYYYGTAESTVSSGELAMLRGVAEELIAFKHGTVPTDTPAWLLVASPHSGTTFEILGAVGTSLLVLAACLVAADLLRWGVYPLAAAGSMALTCYVGHIVVLAALGDPTGGAPPWLWETFVIAALLCATVWKLLLGRGPLERLLGTVADLAIRRTAPRPPDGSRPPGAAASGAH